ncbi:MAG: hypothetical protein AAGC68_14165 [Verrucomicrobiota bacterium]
MRGDIDTLYEELERAPEDWSVRIRLIEASVEVGDMIEAKRLVRTSPGNDPLPGELQTRIYNLLMEGAKRSVQHLPKAEDS